MAHLGTMSPTSSGYDMTFDMTLIFFFNQPDIYLNSTLLNSSLSLCFNT